MKELNTKTTIIKKEPELVISGNNDNNVKKRVFILHETLGIGKIDGWNPKNNDGVVGILLIDDIHQIVVALEDATEKLPWSETKGVVNQTITFGFESKWNFDGNQHCKNLNSPDYPAAYYCLNYKKGGREWYLPASGEMVLICSYMEEIQEALRIVGGQEFATEDDKHSPAYWTSTEATSSSALVLYPQKSCLFKIGLLGKVESLGMVRPVSKFNFSKDVVYKENKSQEK